MSKLIAIGEALIDFVALEKDVSLSNSNAFNRVAGGAPANVAACVSRLGGDSMLLTKLGLDAFGDHIIDVLNQAGVYTNHIKRTHDANTGLAFVSVDKDGNRDFSFYRNPSSDLLYKKEDIPLYEFQTQDILHFCSVDLIDSPMKEAHECAIEEAHKNGLIVSFDPNIRLPLWSDPHVLRKTVMSFIPKSHILKISDDELEFITGFDQIEEALDVLFVGHVEIVIFTLGAKGAMVFLKGGLKESHQGFTVDVKDTTGAGDSFIGAIIYQLLSNQASTLTLQEQDWRAYLTVANKVASIVASRVGAIPSMPTINEIKKTLL